MSAPADFNDGSCRLSIGVWGDRSCSALLEHIHCRNCPVYIETGRRLLDRAPDADQLEHWQQSLVMEDLQSGEAKVSVVVFRIGAEWLALPTSMLREVMDPTPAHRVPHRQDARFRGLVNVRGELMPCIDLGQVLNPSQAAGPVGKAWPRLLVIERQEVAWAFRVDDVDGVHRIPVGELRAPPVTVGLGSSSFTAYVFSLEFNFVYLPEAGDRQSPPYLRGRGVQLEAVHTQLKAASGALTVQRLQSDVVLLDEELLLLALREVCQ